VSSGRETLGNGEPKNFAVSNYCSGGFFPVRHIRMYSDPSRANLGALVAYCESNIVNGKASTNLT